MTRKTVTDWAKKNFLHWFIENYLAGNEDVKQILIQIAETDSLLGKVHIISDGSYLRPLLVISTEDTGMPPFLLKTFDTTVTETGLIKDRLRLLGESPIYLTFYFPDRATCEPFQAVAEENPFSLDSASARQLLIDFELSLWTETFKQEMERSELMAQIDQALDEKNKRKFQSLVKKLKNLK